VIRFCRKCGTELVLGENWTEAKRRYFDYICHQCIVIRAKLRYQTHTAYFKLYAETHREQNRQWKINNKNRLNKLKQINKKKKRQIDPCYRIGENLRVALRKAIKNNTKHNSAIKSLCMPLSLFKLHIQAMFQGGCEIDGIWHDTMTWNNYGPTWHLDHIKPLTSFDLTDPAQFIVAFHWTNYQPLFARDNLNKRAKLDWKLPDR
jgi:hypothetical protein